MSMRDVRGMVAGLPPSLGDQVIGYAESVERALPDIFRDAARPATDAVSSEVVFVAGLKKLHWLVASSYWTLENSGQLLATMDVTAIRVGSTDLSRGGEAYSQLRRLLADLEDSLGRHEVLRYVQMPWSEVIEELSGNGHR